MYKLFINRRIQTYSWPFSWSNKGSFLYQSNIYNTRQFNVFKTHIPTSNRYGLNSIPHKANQLWNLLPENLKLCPSLTLLKNQIKLWLCFVSYCVCFTQFLVFLLHSRQFLILVWVLSRSFINERANAQTCVNNWRGVVLAELH